MNSDYKHQLVLKKRGIRSHRKNVQETYSYDRGVIVWANIMHNGRIPLNIFEEGTVTSQWYFTDALHGHVRFSRDAINPEFLFMDNNARQLRKLMCPPH